MFLPRLCWTNDSISEPRDFPSITAGCVTITFAPYELRKEYNINITDDSWGEKEFKTFNIAIKNNDAAVTFNDTTSYNVALHDDDNTYCLTSTSFKVYEEDHQYVNITIRRTGAITTTNSSVLMNTNNQEASACEDFDGITNQTLSFLARETEKTISIRITNDKLVENNETFQFSLSGSEGSTVFPECKAANVTIISNDVNISCNSSGIEDVFENRGPVVIKFSRVGSLQYHHTMRIQTHDDVATSSNDFTAINETFTFNAGQATIEQNVVFVNDMTVEMNETFQLSVTTSDPRVNMLCPNITFNILNDDTYIFFCPSPQMHIQEAAGPYVVRLCRVGRTSVSHTVELCWTDDSTGLSHDFPSITAGCVIITFAPNDLRKEYNINITNDSWGEKEFKIFYISIKNNDTTTSFNDTATSYNVTLHDDDNSFCVTKTSLKVNEQTDKYVNITIRRTGAITKTNAVVKTHTSPNKANTPEDYLSSIDNKLFTFLVNETEKTVSVKINNDKLTEDEQMFHLSLVGQNGSNVFPDCNTTTITIVSNDVNIFCRRHSGFQRVFENQSPVLIEFTREGSTQYNHTIRIRTIAGTAHSGSDFLPIDKVLTFVSGQTRIKQNVTFVKDLKVEPDEGFRLEVKSSDNRVNVLCPKIDFVIRNDDTFVRCVNSTISVSEEKRNVSFVLKREGTKNKASPIWYSTVDGTAYDKADYKPVNKITVTFLPGQEYMTLSVEIVNDQVYEEDETFAVVIGSHVSTTLTSSPCTNITIKDNDLGKTIC
ncbi:hypothetical protein QZH41_010952 [Actinostola sp. cb2023]|nr:hypothetical protein QZH41_010952 [Actinostola sp. cb2023]